MQASASRKAVPRLRRASAAVLVTASVLAVLEPACRCDLGRDLPPQPILDGGGLDGAVDLGDVPVGTTAEAYAVLTNGPFFPDRIAPLTIGAISVEGTDLWVDEGCEGQVLSQAGSCPIRISWAPATAGALEGRLVVTSDAPASPTSVAIVGVAIP